MRRHILVLLSVVLLAPASGSACRSPVAASDSRRPQCSPDDADCLLDSLTLTENGQPVELVRVNAFPMDGGFPTTRSPSAPQITSLLPQSLTFASGEPQSIDVAFTDPTASAPAIFMFLLPRPGKARCALQVNPCCGGCRATRRVFDKKTSGTIHYQATTSADPTTTTTFDAVTFPVSCAEPGVDPVAALTGGGPACTYLTGVGIGTADRFDAPPSATPPSNPPSSSGSGSAGGCKTDADCGCTKCSAPNGGICGPDGTCRCCYAICSGTSCACNPLDCPGGSQCSKQIGWQCVGSRCATTKGLPKCG